MTLFDAIAAQSVEQLEAVLGQTRDVNELGEGQTTPLIEAARQGWLEGVERLLEAGAEPSCKDASAETALLKAAANGHSAVVRRLMPLAPDDERDLAQAFLKAHGASYDPEFHYDENRLQKRAVEFAARVANFAGHEEPLNRVNRVARAESQTNRDHKGRK